jgi:glycine hydroxymethyltransferase
VQDAHQQKLSGTDPVISDLILREAVRQEDGIELIASENYVSAAVLEAVGSILTNKYAEGYPGKRYYGGCEVVDQVEQLAIDRCKTLFGAEHVNVQPHSGSQANDAALAAMLKPGDKVLSLDFSHGGHLTHGHPLSFSGQRYQVAHYGVNPATGTIDYDALCETAVREKPHVIICGASAYSRAWDFARIREAADACGALVLADIAHIAGLVATGLHSSPFPHADVVTATTHKTLRGPRGGIIMCKQRFAAAVDRAVFPGAQGGPLVHVIAGKAVAFGEALLPKFRTYQEQVLKNASVMADAMRDAGLKIVSGGTDTHLFLVDLSEISLTGADAEALLGSAGITVNKNAVPNDPRPPRVTSGIRIGTPAITTRGMGAEEAREIGMLIAGLLAAPRDPDALARTRESVRALTTRFPLA